MRSKTAAIAAGGAPGGSGERIRAGEMLTELLVLLTVICSWPALSCEVASALLPGGLTSLYQTGSGV